MVDDYLILVVHVHFAVENQAHQKETDHIPSTGSRTVSPSQLEINLINEDGVTVLERGGKRRSAAFTIEFDCTDYENNKNANTVHMQENVQEKGYSLLETKKYKNTKTMSNVNKQVPCPSISLQHDSSESGTFFINAKTKIDAGQERSPTASEVNELPTKETQYCTFMLPISASIVHTNTEVVGENTNRKQNRLEEQVITISGVCSTSEDYNGLELSSINSNEVDSLDKVKNLRSIHVTEIDSLIDSLGGTSQLDTDRDVCKHIDKPSEKMMTLQIQSVCSDNADLLYLDTNKRDYTNTGNQGNDESAMLLKSHLVTSAGIADEEKSESGTYVIQSCAEKQSDIRSSEIGLKSSLEKLQHKTMSTYSKVSHVDSNHTYIIRKSAEGKSIPDLTHKTTANVKGFQASSAIQNRPVISCEIGVAESSVIEIEDAEIDLQESICMQYDGAIEKGTMAQDLACSKLRKEKASSTS